MMHIVLMTVLAVEMIVQSGKDDRSACAAACRCTKGALKPSAFASKLIDVGSLEDWIAETARIAAPIIADVKNDIGFRSCGRILNSKEEQEEANEPANDSRRVLHEIRF